MATNFFSRWSQRKLEDPQERLNELAEESDLQDESLQANTAEPNTDVELPVDSSIVSDMAEPEEQMSVASLLTSEASESIKKAALRKLFLSEEFNVRDGLDDYDDDYSNLQSLSEGVADKLRDWVKDKPEESIESAQVPNEDTVVEEAKMVKEESAEHGDTDDLPVVEGDEGVSDTGKVGGLYKNTVPKGSDTLLAQDRITSQHDSVSLGQNIPHEK
ncbi:DUF3306 domain-containing protein [Vibrio paucivorans]|uniref:DUF3306 domain-containing protein n=1 Tax=Vibrio paucivorans TaxID=2829489 RepID=A0A9X3HTE0_9VIBR|nr:DUF3306 domain-containing protein [Vibrio paucivorans]MCW8335563.1 DUF3306 domain-containing protein [Vibrio paucivorans]